MLKEKYLEAVGLIERVHHQLTEAIKLEFSKLGWNEVTATQALLMFNLGDQEISPTDLRRRGLYLGTNASYNLTKLVQGGYIFHTRSAIDRRSVRIKLTPKGVEVAEVVNELYGRQLQAMSETHGLDDLAFRSLTQSLDRLERFLVQEGTRP